MTIAIVTAAALSREAIPRPRRSPPPAAEQIYRVIDARARAKLLFFVTTNLMLDELYSPYSMQ